MTGLLCLGLAGCAPLSSTAREEAGMQPEGIARVVTDDGYTFTDAPVEARIGRHRYRIPANYYYDQMGPTFQGDVSLRMLWPDMTPMPPGTARRRTRSEIGRSVVFDIYYVDRVDIRERMRRAYSNSVMSADSLEYRNPEDRLDLRVPQPESMGLVRYDLDPGLAAQYEQEYRKRYGRPYAPVVGVRKDWYVARDDTGEVTTFIQCDPREEPEDHVVTGRDPVLSENLNGRIAKCSHMMILPQENLRVSIDYARDLLRDWKKFEGSLEELLEKTRVK